jgi:hypothetical protein
VKRGIVGIWKSVFGDCDRGSEEGSEWLCWKDIDDGKTLSKKVIQPRQFTKL